MNTSMNSNIQKLMQEMTLITAIDDGVSVTTHCLYPSNGTVSVYVRKQLDGYIVSDNRGATEEVDSAGLKFPGLRITDIDKKVRSIVNSQGLLVSNGIIEKNGLTKQDPKIHKIASWRTE